MQTEEMDETRLNLDPYQFLSEHDAPNNHSAISFRDKLPVCRISLATVCLQLRTKQLHGVDQADQWRLEVLYAFRIFNAELFVLSTSVKLIQNISKLHIVYAFFDVWQQQL